MMGMAAFLGKIFSRLNCPLVGLFVIFSLYFLKNVIVFQACSRGYFQESWVCSYFPSALNIGGKDFSHYMGYEPIDIVYTWVNGSDERWRKEREKWQSEISKKEEPTGGSGGRSGEEGHQNLSSTSRKLNYYDDMDWSYNSGLYGAPYDEWRGLGVHSDVAVPSPDKGNGTKGSGQQGEEEDVREEDGENRFRDSNELKYSLRSVEKYAPWVRRVYLVTNGQVPSWLDLGSKKLTLVTHAEIFPDRGHLPVFSSPAIESHLHRIPGLSRKFVYFNDDVFLGAPVWPEDFVYPSGKQKVFLAWDVPPCATGCFESYLGDGMCDAACNVTACGFDFPDCVNATSYADRYGYGTANDYWGGGGGGGDQCAPSCPNTWLADGVCDRHCNTAGCAFDAGDCGLGRVYGALPGGELRPRTHAAGGGVGGDSLTEVEPWSSSYMTTISTGTKTMYLNISRAAGPLNFENITSISAWHNNPEIIKEAIFVKRHATLILFFAKDMPSVAANASVNVEIGLHPNTSKTFSSIILLQKEEEVFLSGIEDLPANLRRPTLYSSPCGPDLPEIRPEISTLLKLNASWPDAHHLMVEGNQEARVLWKAPWYSFEARLEGGGKEAPPLPPSDEAAVREGGGPSGQEAGGGRPWAPTQRVRVVQTSPATGGPLEGEGEGEGEDGRGGGEDEEHGGSAEQGARGGGGGARLVHSPPAAEVGEEEGAAAAAAAVLLPAPWGLGRGWRAVRVALEAARGEEGGRGGGGGGAVVGTKWEEKACTNILINWGTDEQQQKLPETDSDAADQHFDASEADSEIALTVDHNLGSMRKTLSLQEEGISIQHSTLGQEAIVPIRVAQQFAGTTSFGHKRKRFIRKRNGKNALARNRGNPSNSMMHDFLIFYDKLKHSRAQRSSGWESFQFWRSTVDQLMEGLRESGTVAKLAALGSQRKLLDSFGDSLRHVDRLYTKIFGPPESTRKVIAHMPHMIDKVIMEEMQQQFKDEWEKTSSNRFRSSDDMQYAFAYFWWLQNRYRLAEDETLRAWWRDSLDVDGDGALSPNEEKTLGVLVDGKVDGATAVSRTQLRECMGLHGDERPSFVDFTSCKRAVTAIMSKGKRDPEHVVDDDTFIAFEMLDDDEGSFMNKVNWIREKRPKFFCLNDNMKNPSEAILNELWFFFESYFPHQSQFELAPNYINRYQYIEDYQRMQFYFKLMVLGLVVITIILVFMETNNAEQAADPSNREGGRNKNDEELRQEEGATPGTEAVAFEGMVPHIELSWKERIRRAVWQRGGLQSRPHLD